MRKIIDNDYFLVINITLKYFLTLFFFVFILNVYWLENVYGELSS